MDKELKEYYVRAALTAQANIELNTIRTYQEGHIHIKGVKDTVEYYYQTSIFLKRKGKKFEIDTEHLEELIIVKMFEIDDKSVLRLAAVLKKEGYIK